MAKRDSIPVPSNIKDEIGNVYGKLIVVEFLGTRNQAARWLCRCECGKCVDVRGAMLHYGSHKSCGCARYTANGLYHSAEHRSWTGMIQRCTNVRRPRYRDYGGRGIKVCQRWRDSFLSFYEDMGPKPSPKHSLDRIDNDGNYEPGNCRWATNRQQTQNSRRARNLTYQGETLCISEWARRYGLDPDTLAARLKRGWSTERAIATPVP